MLTAIAAACLLAAAGRSAAPADEKPAAANTFSEKIAPFVAHYCGECHSGPKPEAKLNLTQYKDPSAMLRDRKVWRKVLAKLEATEMPPEDQTQPSADERARIIHWIDDQLARPVPMAAQNPGRVTIRRLNRAEYNNTIRDLVGADPHPADDFPSDEVGYGFDNIGDVLSLPPLLMERYLAAAERVLARALETGPLPPVRHRFLAAMLDATAKTEPRPRGARRVVENGELRPAMDCAARWRLHHSAQLYGDKMAKLPLHLALKIDDREVAKSDDTINDDNQARYPLRAKLTTGEHRVALEFRSERLDPKQTDPKKPGGLLICNYMEIEEPQAVGPILPEAYSRIVVAPPDPLKPFPAERTDCARRIVRHFADRAFRRPVNDDELARLMRLWEAAEKDGGSFEQSLQPPLAAVLVSPHFLFRVEIDPPANSAPQHTIGDFELASRLSYFLWSSMPDDELFAVAGRGDLHKDATLDAQVRRMLRDPKSRALVDNFAAQWIQFRRLVSTTPDKTTFANFDEPLRAAMQQETEMFFAHVVREDRTVLDFLDADYTFLNERLARHYGIPNVHGDQFRLVHTTDGRRGGLLTQASVLLITSNPGRTSPVKRGKWILDNLLGEPPPPPAPNVPKLPDDSTAVANASLRQRMERHRADLACASCHKVMDPLGFGLENFDAIGAWRTQDGRFPVDSSGELPGGRKFNGVAELKKVLLTRRDAFCRCLAGKLLTYALGRGLEDYDEAAVDQIAHAAAQSDYRFSSFVNAIIRSAPFQMRRGPVPPSSGEQK